MSSTTLIHDNRLEILRIAKANGATRVRIFGSFAHGTAGPDSDVDLLVDLEPSRHLFDIVAMGQDLEDFLGRPVHVVTEGAISPYIRDEIIREASPL
ncbi:MAG: nucleotidyltransferase family protein [Chloroflexia bacterium]|nr:nucleotidyltransferase family protein [Chloroflexia bacterium]